MTLTEADRNKLIRIAKARAKQAERDAETREQVLRVEVVDLMNAEFEAQDKLWDEAVAIANETAVKTNEQICARCSELGIPGQYAPMVEMAFHRRSPELSGAIRRGELRELAEERLKALTKTAKTKINRAALDIEEQLIIGGLETDAARAVISEMPAVEALMPALGLEDLGVARWQPDEDAAAQLMTPMTTAQRRARQIRRAIEANPGASDRKVAEIAGVDHKTVGAHRRGGGELGGELAAASGEFPAGDEDDDR
jgi:hypothetical protein